MCGVVERYIERTSGMAYNIALSTLKSPLLDLFI